MSISASFQGHQHKHDYHAPATSQQIEIEKLKLANRNGTCHIHSDVQIRFKTSFFGGFEIRKCQECEVLRNPTLKYNSTLSAESSPTSFTSFFFGDSSSPTTVNRVKSKSLSAMPVVKKAGKINWFQHLNKNHSIELSTSPKFKALSSNIWPQLQFQTKLEDTSW